MKYLIAIIIAFFSLSASAGNDYCDSRPGNTRNTCYQQAVNGNMRVINKYLRAIYASPKVSQEKKDDIEKRYTNWVDRINSQCRTNACMYNSLKDAAIKLRMEMGQLGVE